MFEKLCRAIAARHLKYLQRHAASELLKVYDARESVLAQSAQALEQLAHREKQVVNRLSQLAVREIAVELEAGEAVSA